MPFYTRTGDQGTSGILSGNRFKKDDLIFEALGTIDEADAWLGVARSQCKTGLCKQILRQVQQDLWLLMADVASIDKKEKFRENYIGEEHLQQVEKFIEQLAATYDTPKGFIIPGDVYSAGLLDVARTIVRRAERRFIALQAEHAFHNPHVMPYLNRLSSLCYALELSELQAGREEQ